MQENQQSPEKQVKLDPADPTRHIRYSVHSIFHTIQGEGPFAGRPCVFVRLAGCNLQCNFCDTDYTEGRRDMLVREIFDEVAVAVPAEYDFPSLVVVTGGEPFRQPIGPLIEYLNRHGLHVQIETNGTLYQPDVPYTWTPVQSEKRGFTVDARTWASSTPVNNPLLTIVCSPKAGKVARDLQPHIDAYKYVVEDGFIDPNDGLPTLALRHAARPRVARPHEAFGGTVYVQPIDVQDDALNAVHTAAAIRSCMQHGYTLCLQTHKIVNLP